MTMRPISKTARALLQWFRLSISFALRSYWLMLTGVSPTDSGSVSCSSPSPQEPMNTDGSTPSSTSPASTTPLRSGFQKVPESHLLDGLIDMRGCCGHTMNVRFNFPCADYAVQVDWMYARMIEMTHEHCPACRAKPN